LAEMTDAIRVGCGPNMKMPKVKTEITVWTGAWEKGEELKVGYMVGWLSGVMGVGPSRVIVETAVVRAARARLRRRRVEEGIVALDGGGSEV
jgi:hypothetical protein